MNYELAKELKDAGFESKHSSEDAKYPDKDGYVPPNLSELIEACGERFGELYRFPQSWSAEEYGNSGVEGNGSTPEEAVARLWLALNNK